MIRLNAFCRLENGNRRGEVIAAATELVGKSRAEAGCVAYDFFASETNAENFMFCETWADDEALSKHARSEHFVRLVAVIEGICGPMKLERFEF